MTWLDWLRSLFAKPKPKPVPPRPVPPKPVPKPPAPVPAPPAPPAPPIKDDAAYLALLNVERAREGLAPMALDATLNRVAQAWASEMAAAERMSHDGFPGRVEAVYPGLPCGEIVASGWPDGPYFRGENFRVPDAFSAWMQSPGHRAEMMGDYNRTGIGSARSATGTMYFCSDFVRA